LDTNEPFYNAAATLTAFVDFQNFHSSSGGEHSAKINQQAGKFQDTQRYATPAGLQQVMQ
jgi:hypothetical protein